MRRPKPCPPSLAAVPARHRSQLPLARGLTLVELLIGAVVSALSLAVITRLTVQQANISDDLFTQASLDRRFRRFADLMRADFAEACQLRTGATSTTATDPRRATTAPDTSCNPPPVSACGNLTTGVSTPASGVDLWMVLPNVDTTTGTLLPRHPLIRYYRGGTLKDGTTCADCLFRDGPPVNANGSLNNAATAGNPGNPPPFPLTALPAYPGYTSAAAPGNQELVMSNVAAFTTTVSPDCSWATINLRLNPPSGQACPTSTTNNSQMRCNRVFTFYVNSDLSIS